MRAMVRRLGLGLDDPEAHPARGRLGALGVGGHERGQVAAALEGFAPKAASERGGLLAGLLALRERASPLVTGALALATVLARGLGADSLALALYTPALELALD